MDTHEIYQRIAPIFHEVFESDALEVTPATCAADVPGWDSLNNIRLMMSIQRRFGVRFSAAEIGRLQNVGQLVGLIGAKL